MKYQFPIIENIEQVRKAIEGCSEFVEYNRGTHIVFNYHVAFEDSFPPVKTSGGSAKMREQAEYDKSVRRECRGLIFSPEGKIISRRLHKFFNMNERQETDEKNIDWSQPHFLLEKLDGSMITPLDLPSGLEWGTKMGVTDIGYQCKQYVKKNTQYIDFARFWIKDGYTPIFEYMSPSNRVVIEHHTDKLTLLAIRHNLSGGYVPYEQLVKTCLFYNIPIVSPVSMSLLDIRTQEDTEGVVVRFNDGHMVKVKTDWYVRIHKAKDNLLFEKNVIKLILEEKLDDILPWLPEADKNRMVNYQKELLENISAETFLIHCRLANFEKTLNKKDYALRYADSDNNLTRTAIFSCWGTDKSIREFIIQYILKHTVSQSSVDTIRYLLPDWKK